MKIETKVLQWAKDRQIFAKATPYKQALKTLEECGELLHSIGQYNEAEIKDAIGDIIVTLIIQAEMQGTTIEECLESAYDVIKNRSGKTANRTFIKD